MRELFVDTSAWFPLAVRSHPDHLELANTLRAHVTTGTRVVTTNLVVAESHALLLRRVGIPAARAFVRRVRQPPNVIVESTERLETLAVDEWLERFADQDSSLTDAVSFAVMRERGIGEALTLDHHFMVAGFARAVQE